MALDVEALYRRYGPMVLRRCRELLRDEEKALDAMQDTFVRVLDRQDRLQDTAPGGLLYRVATNVCLNVLRSQSRHRTDGDTTVVERIAASGDEPERVLTDMVLERIFRREPASTRTMAVMHWVDRMTLAEVADESGLSISGVRRRLRTLRKRVADLREVGTV